ncbi:hypothetical protein PV04_05437 [Phialophora macrospora]|uniref:Uncharacterized protein n=1 Tax=Phialophora macrospora TaxID=1851006 RepID=A0A0D2E5F9_9EURO|nr:hypothetical protein PV04_05437 [Phialophora macrospora]
MPKKRTPLKRDATPTRIMTRPSKLRTPRPSANPPASNNPLPTVDEESDEPASSPIRATAKPKAKTPVKPKTPAKPKKPAAPKATAKKGTRKSKTPKAAAPAVVDLSGDDSAEERDGGSPEKGIVIPSADSSPLSSPVSVPSSPYASAKTPKTVKRRRQALDGKPYKDVDASDDEPAPSPTAKAVAGPNRKSVQFADRTYKPDEESSDEEDDPQPQAVSRKRKLPNYEDEASEADDEEQENTDPEEDSDYLYFLGDLARSTEAAAGFHESPVRAPVPQAGVSGDAQLQESLLLTIDSASSVISESVTDSTVVQPSRRFSISSVRGSNYHSPKRLRVNPPAAVDPPNIETADSSTDEDQANDPSDPIRAAKVLFSKAQQAPGPLDLGEISALFMVLQEQISAFCKRHFNFDLTPAQEEAWPLHLLVTKHKPLFEVTQWIADGSGCGWRNFFTKKENRRHLVHGIIGEFFQQHIFKHTAFGIREDMVEALEDIDREYLRYDAFVRNKKKAAYLEKSRLKDGYFPTPGSRPQQPQYPPTHQYQRDVDLAVRRLVSTILQVLEPLLPPPCFDPLVRRSRQTTSQRNQGALMRNGIWFDLFDLISKAATLHHCIRFAGASGLVVRIAPHVAKGTMFTVDDADRNICVNAAELNASASRPQGTGTDARLRVKMTCFGRVEAVMPRGLDLEQMETEQNAAKAAGHILTREDAERKLFPKLPYELQETEAGRNAVAHLNPVPGTEWNTALYQASVEDHVDQRFRRQTTPSLSTEAAASHPFVTIYPRVAPSNLYCEWVSVAQSPSDSASPDRGGQTLWEAVLEARSEHFASCLLEDAWNTVSDPRLLRQVLGWSIATGVGVFGTRALVRMLASPRSQEALTGVQSNAGHALSAFSAAGASATSYLSALLTSSTRTSTTLWATRIDPRERMWTPRFYTTRDTITSTVTGRPRKKPNTLSKAILDALLGTPDSFASSSSELATTVTTPMEVDDDSTMESSSNLGMHDTLTSTITEDTTIVTVPMELDDSDEPTVDSSPTPETHDPLSSTSVEDVTTMTPAPTPMPTPMDVDESTTHSTPASQTTLDANAAQEILKTTETLSGSAGKTPTTKPFTFHSTVKRGTEEFSKIQEMIRKRMKAEGRLVE